MANIMATPGELMQLSMGIGYWKECYESSTAQDTTNTFQIIQVLSDTVFAHLGQYLTPEATSVTDLAASGHVLYGLTVQPGIYQGTFNNVQLTSGRIRALSFRPLV